MENQTVVDNAKCTNCSAAPSSWNYLYHKLWMKGQEQHFTHCYKFFCNVCNIHWIHSLLEDTNETN